MAWCPTEASSDSRPPGKTSGIPAANESWVRKRKTQRHNFQLFSPPSHTGCPCYRFPERAAALLHSKPVSAGTCRYSYHVYGHDKGDILYNSFVCLFPLGTTNKQMTARGAAETRCGCDSYPSVLSVRTAGTVLYGWKGGLRVLWKTATREWGAGEN